MSFKLFSASVLQDLVAFVFETKINSVVIIGVVFVCLCVCERACVCIYVQACVHEEI